MFKSLIPWINVAIAAIHHLEAIATGSKTGLLTFSIWLDKIYQQVKLIETRIVSPMLTVCHPELSSRRESWNRFTSMLG